MTATNNQVFERELPYVRSTEQPPAMEGERLSGYAVVYGVQTGGPVNLDGQYAIEVIDRGAFDNSLANRIPFVFNHRDFAEYADNQTGTLLLTPDDRGIRFSMSLPAYAQHLREEIASGAIRGMSFGIKSGAQFETINGIRHITNAVLTHIAPVYSPAYLDTSVRLERSDPHALKKKLLALKEK